MVFASFISDQEKRKNQNQTHMFNAINGIEEKGRKL